MKERLTNNLWLKLLSIFAAFFVWLVVVNFSNPVVLRTKDLPVAVVNDDVLDKSQLTYEIVEKGTVTVRYQVHTLDSYKLQDDDFRVYIDLNDLYEPTGAVPIQVDVLNHRDLITDVTTRPDVLHIKTENLQRKGFKLEAITVGKPADGYARGFTTLGVESVYVEGPESLVGQISSMGVEIKVDGASSDVSGSAAPKCYDANGNELTLGERVKVSAGEVTYETQILKVKELTLDFETDGEVADGYRFTGVECDTKSVSVIGSKSALASANTITVPSSVLSIEGASEDKTVEIDITPYLPPNTTLAGDQKMVTITMKVEPLENRRVTLKIDDMLLTGKSDQYVYSIEPEEVEVVVRGLNDDINSLQAADLNAVLDVTNLVPGSQKGALEFDTGDAFDVVSYSDFIVTSAMKSTEASSSESSQGGGKETEKEKPLESQTAQTQEETGS